MKHPTEPDKTGIRLHYLMICSIILYQLTYNTAPAGMINLNCVLIELENTPMV